MRFGNDTFYLSATTVLRVEPIRMTVRGGHGRRAGAMSRSRLGFPCNPRPALSNESHTTYGR